MSEIEGLYRDEFMNTLKFDADGLIPAVVQDEKDGTVLMVGYMNVESLQKTLQTRKVTFWSRSRRTLWTKGETSGHFLEMLQLFTDCDRDTLLVTVIPHGPTCHTDKRSCFSWQFVDE